MLVIFLYFRQEGEIMIILLLFLVVERLFNLLILLIQLNFIFDTEVLGEAG